MAEGFKDFRSNKEKPREDLTKNADCQEAIREHIMEKMGVSNNALVSLVVHATRNTPVNENDVKELEFFGYIAEGTITTKGKAFLDEEETIDRLKKMIGY